jgi:hypothetical protein
MLGQEDLDDALLTGWTFVDASGKQPQEPPPLLPLSRARMQLIFTVLALAAFCFPLMIERNVAATYFVSMR